MKALVRQCDVLLVVGSANSSNSNRLRELGTLAGVRAYLVDGPEDLQAQWFEGCAAVGVTAGASAPESIVQGVVQRLTELGGTAAEEMKGREEHIVFSLPPQLRRAVETREPPGSH